MVPHRYGTGNADTRTGTGTFYAGLQNGIKNFEIEDVKQDFKSVVSNKGSMFCSK
jgi:hypothetical protein